MSTPILEEALALRSQIRPDEPATAQAAELLPIGSRAAFQAQQDAGKFVDKVHLFLTLRPDDP